MELLSCTDALLQETRKHYGEKFIPKSFRSHPKMLTQQYQFPHWDTRKWYKLPNQLTRIYLLAFIRSLELSQELTDHCLVRHK